jgi:DNA polymerase III subunit gamma/tau
LVILSIDSFDRFDHSLCIMAWYNTYRPQTFDDVIGQELVKSVLQNALLKDKIKHAYLLNGPKGVGKTTLARIFANQLNDITSKPEAKIDIIEMDAASNTGIEDIRQLIESAKIPPISGKYKIYIIDEVHMLSKSAMNALLKILEEPPSYIIFLLATTNPEKLIPTVLSRLTKLNLSAHTEEGIISRLKHIAQKEDLKIDEPALKIIAKRSGGSQRDAINLMETLSAYELDTYDQNNTAELLGLLPEELLLQLAEKINQKQFDHQTISLLEKTGMDGETILIQLLEFLLDKSFSGDTTFDALILPIAGLLESKLPITSIPAVLALLHVSLKSTTTAPASPSPQIPAKSVAQVPAPVPTQAVSESPPVKPETEKLKNSDTKTVPAVKNQAPLPTTPGDYSVSSVADVIETLSKDNSSPPIFKMLATDLVVERVESGTITFSVTNGIFVAQLGSPKLQEWLKDNLSQKLGGTCIIKVEQREASASPVIDIPAPETEQPNIDPKPEKKVEAPKAEEKIAQKKEPKTTEDKIFYKIYNELPEEIKDSKIPVYKGEIPDPQPKSAEGDDWDSHAEDMFEFE